MAMCSAQMCGTPVEQPVLEPGEGSPTVGGETLSGPGFSLQLPAGYTLEKSTPSAGEIWTRYYSGSSGTWLGVSVASLGLAQWNSPIEGATFRTTGWALSKTGDKVFLAEATINGSQARQAMGMLADGNIVAISVLSSQGQSSLDMYLMNLVSSLDLVGTDGKQIDGATQGSPVLDLVVWPGYLILSNETVWRPRNVLDVQTWHSGDFVFPQSDVGLLDAALANELVKVGEWEPVSVLNCGPAHASTITSIGIDTLTLADQTIWPVDPGTALQLNRNEAVLWFEDDETYLVHNAMSSIISVRQE